MGNIFHKKGDQKREIFGYYWRGIKKLKKRKGSSDKRPIDYHVHYSLTKTLLNTIIAVINLSEAQFFNPSSTNLLTRVH